MQSTASLQVRNIARPSHKRQQFLSEREIAIYQQGGWLEQVAHRVPYLLEAHTIGFLFELFWTLGGLMIVGMALYKWGVLSNALSGFLVVWVWRWRPLRQFILGISMFALPSVFYLLLGIGYLFLPAEGQTEIETELLAAFGADFSPAECPLLQTSSRGWRGSRPRTRLHGCLGP